MKNLEKKKALASKTLGVGANRIIFNQNSLDDIKEAITRQDIMDLHAGGAIMIREIKGRKKIEKRKTRRRAGSIKMPKIDTKRKYINRTRKLRAYLKELKSHEQINQEEYDKLRQKIRASLFKDKSHLKDFIQEMKK